MSSILSDFNSKNAASNVSRGTFYSDIPLSFIPHPNKKDISSLVDIDAVRASVKNLLLTSFYERPFQPDVGSAVASLLFEPVDVITSVLIKDEIKKTLEEHEPRVSGVFVEIEPKVDLNLYNITISFNVIFSNEREEINFYLNRTR